LQLSWKGEFRPGLGFLIEMKLDICKRGETLEALKHVSYKRRVKFRTLFWA
jgi:hypothetical protein